MLVDPVKVSAPCAEGVLTLEVIEHEGQLCCRVYHFEGEIRLPPKLWLRAVRQQMRRIEKQAAAAGCAEMHIEGRDWSRVFPDYEPLPTRRNGLRKVI